MIPIVISGGKGTRLWPFSRAQFPKPFCEFFEENLMEKTLQRLARLGKPGVVSVSNQKALTQISFRKIGLAPSFEIFEPFGRNTAASVALVCHVLTLQKKEKEVVGIFPADQLIQNNDNFVAAAQLAEIRAKEGHLVTLGIQPTYPATGFGYIEMSESSAKDIRAIKAKKFHEKPSADLAKNYVESGRYFWNAGIFIFKVEKMSQFFAQYAPELWKQIKNINPDLSNIVDIYKSLASISVDCAIMEKLESNFECIPCDMGWSDVGSWSEIKKFAQSHERYEQQATGNCVFTMNLSKTYAFVGTDDLIVVDTPDALLVTTEAASQKVSQAVEQIEKLNPSVTLEHQFDRRPWGDYEVLRDEEHFKSKIIRVNPGQQISYQSHNKRAEHWIMVSGEAVVTLNEKEIPVRAGDHIYIPVGTKHRIKNASQRTIEFVEVQTGEYFGEDDIIRYTDDYGRA